MKPPFCCSRLSLVLLGFVAACQPTPAPPMTVCDNFDFSDGVDPTVLKNALVHAAEWANENYGEECVVCAGFAIVNGQDLRIHITSPIENAVLNTRALLTYRISDGSFSHSGNSGSCYAWRNLE